MWEGWTGRMVGQEINTCIEIFKMDKGDRDHASGRHHTKINKNYLVGLKG